MIPLCTHYKHAFIIIITCSLFSTHIVRTDEQIAQENESVVAQTSEATLDQTAPVTQTSALLPHKTTRKINKIVVHGNKHVSTDAILHRIPYQIGQIFDASESRTLIRNLYYDLKRFQNITVKKELIGSDLINLHIFVVEKPVLKKIIFKGNRKLDKKEIFKKTNIDNLPSIDKEELQKYARNILDLYKEKSFLNAHVDTQLELDEQGKATALFDIVENNPSIVKQVRFKGNTNITSKQLKKAIYTHEDWLLGFMDNSGSYHPDRVSQGDKYMIEQLYQNRGYINAKVAKIDTDINPKNNNLILTFHIVEGDLYTIKDVKAPGNDVLTEAQILAYLPLRPGMLYSRERIMNSIKGLEALWGNYGYLYASVTPSIEPDDKTKMVSVSFYSELGKEVFLNKISIQGNRKTRDKVIRRKLMLEDGDLITKQKMELSKNRVEALGYFDAREGVNWKTTRISDELADLDLIIKEAKTGNAHIKMGTGGSDISMTDGFKGFSLEASVSDTNLFGSGIHFDATAHGSLGSQSIAINVTQPWMFDRPIYSAIDIYHKRIGYDEFHHANTMNEKHTGGSITTGFVSNLRYPLLNETFIRLMGGFEGVSYDKPPQATLMSAPPGVDRALAFTTYQSVLNKLFQKGEFFTVSLHMGQDKKNHPMLPSRGHSWVTQATFGIEAFGRSIGFYKIDLDANWYTPLIGERDLILHLHWYAGFAQPFKNKSIPYRDLFHIGGPASVRGFLFGEIGPQFNLTNNPKVRGDSVGASKTMFWNAELQFPITPDFTMKGVLFYDGGAGWDHPYADCFCKTPFLRNNSFSYRHSVGVGIRMLNPMPIRIDVGFKLDPRKGESAYEVHFGMAYDF